MALQELANQVLWSEQLHLGQVHYGSTIYIHTDVWEPEAETLLNQVWLVKLQFCFHQGQLALCLLQFLLHALLARLMHTAPWSCMLGDPQRTHEASRCAQLRFGVCSWRVAH
jgi:hypothetical protein